MEKKPKEPKPFDIRERTFMFARDVLTSYPQGVRAHAPSAEVWRQLIRAAGSVGANLEEAHAASGKVDFRYRIKLALREAREAHYWLRLIAAAALQGAPKSSVLLHEANQLVAILTTIAKNAAAKNSTDQ